MKNATQIISLLQNKPQFHKLKKFKCIDKIKSMFLPSFTKFVKFAYFKNNTLFFVLNHNAGKQEFDNSIQNIKSALRFYTPIECQDEEINDIKAFVSHTPTRPILEPKQELKQSYTERASGTLEADLEDEKLSKVFNEIQELIKENK